MNTLSPVEIDRYVRAALDLFGAEDNFDIRFETEHELAAASAAFERAGCRVHRNSTNQNLIVYPPAKDRRTN